jgi:hypothetical protein
MSTREWTVTPEDTPSEPVIPAIPEGFIEDTVLVGCPTYSGLSAVLDEYLDAYSQFEWPKRRLMLVDNSDGPEYARSIKDKVEKVGGTVRHIEPSKDWEDTFSRSWGVLLQHARWNGYTWVLSLEQDVILPPLGLDTLLNVAGYVKAPFVTHTYPYHNGKPGWYQGLGCTLMRTELLGYALDFTYQRIPAVEAAIYDAAKRGSHVVLHRLLDIKHRDARDGTWNFEGTTSDEIAVGIEAAWPDMRVDARA